jgi:hypothetical protein
MSRTGKINYQTYVGLSGGLLERISDYFAVKVRKKIYAQFILPFAPPHAKFKVLDVGATNDETLNSSNVWHSLLPATVDFFVCSDQLPSVNFESHSRGKWCVSSAIKMPFPDKEFHLVISSATLEHVGNRDNQKLMISEITRVCKSNFIVATPNRWHPIEFHTRLPLIHYLPVTLWRKVIKTIGMDYLAEEKNLNLLSRRETENLIESLSSDLLGWKLEVKSIRFLGFVSHLIICGQYRG